jgi:hypothetical protein
MLNLILIKLIERNSKISNSVLNKKRKTVDNKRNNKIFSHQFLTNSNLDHTQLHIQLQIKGVLMLVELIWVQTVGKQHIARIR